MIERVKLFDNYKIRGTAEVTSMDIADLQDADVARIWLESSLDTEIDIQLKGQITNSKTGGENIGGPIHMSQNQQLSFIMSESDWYPFIYATVLAASAPSTGELNVTCAVRRK